MSAYITGVGTTPTGRHLGQRVEELAAGAIDEALEDALESPERVYVGTVFEPPGTALRILEHVGLTGRPAVMMENACASGTTALWAAVEAVENGLCKTALAVGVEQLSRHFDGPITPEATDREGRSGLPLPGLYALMAARYLDEGRATLEDLADVSVKNRKHSEGNERAQFRTPVTRDEVLQSRTIADPLTLLQCCPMSDAAGAAIVSSDGGSGGVKVRSLVLEGGRAWGSHSDEVWGYDIIKRAAARAYDKAGVGPDDVDVVEVHDAFTISELIAVEALGLGGGAPAADSLARGMLTFGGRHPVNPSGGLLSRGHPLGATGLLQTAELVWQLRGQAGIRQVEGARIALIETMGGGAAGLDGNACVVGVLEAPADA